MNSAALIEVDFPVSASPLQQLDIRKKLTWTPVLPKDSLATLHYHLRPYGTLNVPKRLTHHGIVRE